MIADDSAYYEVAARLAPAAWPRLMAQAHSPGELASLAKSLAASPRSSAEEFRLRLGLLVARMETIAPDYRSFAITADQLWVMLQALAARARDLGVPADELVIATRKFAVKQFSSARCNEEFGDAGAFVEWFNLKFRGKLDPIREEETLSIRPLGWAKSESYFSSGSGKAITDAFQRLRTALDTPEWSDRLAEFLRDFPT